MKLIRRNVSKDSNNFYVVTRDGRRIEDINYKSKEDAEGRALRLCDALKKWDKTTLNKVAVVYTGSPNKIY